MHFPIIKIEPIDLPVEDWDVDLDYEDKTLNMWTDYYGMVYTDRDRQNVIKSAWLKELLDGIATIDTVEETITFLDADTIRKTVGEYLLELTARMHEQAEKGELRGFDLRYASVEYKGSPTMFYLEYGYTAFEFIEDAAYHAGETWRIGNIFDAHF